MIPDIIKKLKPLLTAGKKELAERTSDTISLLHAKQFFASSIGRYAYLNEEAKTKLLMVLTDISPSKQLEFISLCLADKLVTVRAIALQAAAAVNDPRLIEKVLPLIKDAEAVVRKLSYEFLGNFPLPQIASVLNKRLSEETDEEAQLALIDALKKIGSQDSLPLLFDQLTRTKKEKIASKIIEAIGRLKL